MIRVIAIRSTDAAKMPVHCERAGFETVISVPLRLHEQPAEGRVARRQRRNREALIAAALGL